MICATCASAQGLPATVRPRLLVQVKQRNALKFNKYVVPMLSGGNAKAEKGQGRRDEEVGELAPSGGAASKQPKQAYSAALLKPPGSSLDHADAQQAGARAGCLPGTVGIAIAG